jgi:hypothetical protein
MEQKSQVYKHAVRRLRSASAPLMQPALTKFYDGLSDEQKARFNSLRAVPVGTHATSAGIVVDHDRSRADERGKITSSSVGVAPPQHLDEE